MSRLMKPRRRRPPILLIVSLLMLIGASALFITELIGFSQRENRLAAGLTLGNVEVGGLLDIEAASAIGSAYTSPVTLYYRDAPINLSPDTIGFEVRVPEMLADARAASETEGGFWTRFLGYLLGRESLVSSNIPLEADYQSDALRDELANIASIYDRPSGSATYNLQTLTFNEGDTGYELDLDAAVEVVDAALRRPENRWVDLPIVGGEEARTSLSTLENMLLEYLDSQGFVYDGQNSVASIFILDLETGEEINILGDVAFSAASTIKVPLLIDFFRILDQEPNQDEAFLMANSLLCSANSSSNLIMETFTGNGNLYSGIASLTNTAQYLGAENTYLNAPFIDGSPNQQLGAIAAPETNPNPTVTTDPDIFNQTTAEDMGTIFSLIYDCAEYGSGLTAAYPDGEITQQECRQMIELMSANDLQRLLQASLPEDARISHKNGWVSGTIAGASGATTADVGIVYSPSGRDYVISVFIWEATDGTGFNRWPLIEEISRATWNFFNPQNQIEQPNPSIPPSAQECFSTDASGQRIYNYLPPYGSVDLNNINGWRDGSPTTPQPPAGSTG